MKNYRTENSRAEKLYPSERTNDNFCKGDGPQIHFSLPPMAPSPPSGYSRSGISGTGTTGSVAKMRLPGSISRITALNSPSPTASHRSREVGCISGGERLVDEPGRLPVGLQRDARGVKQHALSHQVAAQQPRTRFQVVQRDSGRD